MKQVTVTPWAHFSSLCFWSNKTPSSSLFHFRGKQSCSSSPHTRAALYPTLDLLTYNSLLKMRSCAWGCVWVRRGLHEIVSVSRSVSYGQAFSGSMSRSELITLVQCDYVFVCESATLPFAVKPPWPTKRPPLSITHCPRSRINHQLHSELRTSSWPVADIHNMSAWTRSHIWPIEKLPRQVSFRSTPQTTNPLRQKRARLCRRIQTNHDTDRASCQRLPFSGGDRGSDNDPALLSGIVRLQREEGTQVFRSIRAHYLLPSVPERWVPPRSLLMRKAHHNSITGWSRCQKRFDQSTLPG